MEKNNDNMTGEKNEIMVKSMEEAIDYCIANDILADFFASRREDILQMEILDFTFEKQLEYTKRDSLKEGMEEGIKEGIKEGERNHLMKQIQKKLAKNKPLEVIADELEIEMDELKEMISILE